MISLILSEREIQSINVWISKMDPYKGKDPGQKVKKAESILKLKYKRIGNGRSRIVYELNNKYVLKIALSEKGLKGNQTEFEIYKNCPPKLRKHLCPVKEFGYGWIIMKKISLKVPKNEIYDEKLSQLRDRFLKAGIIPHDTRSCNIMLSKKDKIIIIDYGNFKLKQGEGLFYQ